VISLKREFSQALGLAETQPSFRRKAYQRREVNWVTPGYELPTTRTVGETLFGWAALDERRPGRPLA
jgi:hypothetical protein